MTPRAADLRLAPGLTLPLDFASEGLVVIGVRGSGKSNTEVRFAELLFGAGIPFVAVDPKGDWYGIRMDAAAPGLPVPVFGGLYGDFPLDASLGVTIANLLVDENMSAVVDVSRMTHAARATFLTAFFRQLMERHQVEPHVRTVIFEEAHRYIPQQVKAEQAALKEAAAAVLLEGRSFGLGCWACTQRPARLHNDVLEEVDTAIIHRIGVTATADLKRVRDWVKHEDLGDEIGASLTKLKAGEGWVLSPVSLGVVGKFQMDRRTTFDSGATPVVGEGAAIRRRQATMADIDAGAIKEALADAIEKARENDPQEIRKRLARAEARVKELEAWVPPPPVVKSGLSDGVAIRLKALRNGVLERATSFVEEMRALVDTVDEAIAEGSDRGSVPSDEGKKPRKALVTASHEAPKPEVPAPAPPAEGWQTVTMHDEPVFTRLAERKVVAALARLGSPQTLPRVAAQSGYAPRSKGFTNALTQLRSVGYLQGSRDALALTPAGEVAALAIGADAEPPGDLVAVWKANPKLRKAGRAILDALADAWPDALDKDRLAAAAGYAPRSKGFTNELSLLRSLDLVTKGSEIRLTDEIGETVG